MGRLTVSAVPVLNDNYVWLIRDPESGETAAVDPSVAQPVLDAAAAKELRITQVLNTHWHPDHTGGNDGVRDATGCTITAPAEAERVSRIDRIVSEGDRVTVAGAEGIVWDIPAHTSGHIAYYFEDEGMIFVGDTMFAMGCGRLFEGSPEQMHGSLQRLAALPADTRVYCAHEYTLSNARFAAHAFPDDGAIAQRLASVIEAREAGRATVPTTIGQERATNPFLRAASADEFAQLRLAKDRYS